MSIFYKDDYGSSRDAESVREKYTKRSLMLAPGVLILDGEGHGLPQALLRIRCIKHRRDTALQAV